jgi:hypothetical protein
MRSLLSLAAVLALIGSTLVSAQDTNEQSATGKIVVSRHTFKMQAGEMYEAIAEGNGFQPSLQTTYADASTLYAPTPYDASKRFIHRQFLIAKRTGDIPFVVSYPSFPNLDQKLDYTIKLKRIPFAKTPLLEKKDSLTADDPVYSERNSPHKAYPITLKSGKFYMIDMVRKKTSAAGMDPYLYLEDTMPKTPMQKVVANDDDSGGDLNARIVYQATKNGEFRIIATSLNKTPGEFTITVREQE